VTLLDFIGGDRSRRTKPGPNVLQQQARFDTFVAQYNRDRPHQALRMKVPADVYVRSARVRRCRSIRRLWRRC